MFSKQILAALTFIAISIAGVQGCTRAQATQTRAACAVAGAGLGFIVGYFGNDADYDPFIKGLYILGCAIPAAIGGYLVGVGLTPTIAEDIYEKYSNEADSLLSKIVNYDFFNTMLSNRDELVKAINKYIGRAEPLKLGAFAYELESLLEKIKVCKAFLSLASNIAERNPSAGLDYIIRGAEHILKDLSKSEDSLFTLRDIVLEVPEAGMQLGMLKHQKKLEQQEARINEKLNLLQQTVEASGREASRAKNSARGRVANELYEILEEIFHAIYRIDTPASMR